MHNIESTTPITWTPREGSPGDEDAMTSTYSGYISKYLESDDYYWRVRRIDSSEHFLAGTASNEEAAKAAAERHMRLAEEDFADLVMSKLLAELKALERRILEIRPDASLLSGYASGYAAGMAKAKRRVIEAIYPTRAAAAAPWEPAGAPQEPADHQQALQQVWEDDFAELQRLTTPASDLRASADEQAFNELDRLRHDPSEAPQQAMVFSAAHYPTLQGTDLERMRRSTVRVGDDFRKVIASAPPLSASFLRSDPASRSGQSASRPPAPPSADGEEPSQDPSLPR